MSEDNTILRNQKIHIRKFIKEIQKQSYIKECFCGNNECSSQIISAHSIQNNRILKKIATNGEVLSFSNRAYESDDNGSVYLNSKVDNTGQKKATTFTGFCGHHDNEVFNTIENFNYDPENIEQEFLFAYRALAKEYHTKRTQQKSIAIAIRESRNNSPVPRITLGINLILKKLEKERQLFNRILKEKTFKNLITHTIIFENEYHLAASSCFGLENDLYGNIINDYSNPRSNLKHIYLTIFPQNNKTIVLLSYLKRNKRFLTNFIEQIDSLEVIEKQKIISNILAIYCENFVLSPARWSEVSDQKKQLFYDVFKSTFYAGNWDLQKPHDINLFI